MKNCLAEIEDSGAKYRRPCPGIMQDVELLGKVQSSGHRTVRPNWLVLRREQMILVRKEYTRDLPVTMKIEEFRMSLHNRYSALTEDDNQSVQAVNSNLAGIIIECTIEVGSRIVRQSTGKLAE